VLAAISDDVLISINTIEMVAIVYLAIAIATIRERISRIEGKLEQRDRDNGIGRGPPS
jgi:hypothetical protein